jgi:hypothetical protein
MTRRVERVAGGVLVDGMQIGETLQCCHCGGHWDRVPGSGTLRGFCLKCNGVLCGKEACMTECKPFEKWLEEVERGGDRSG